MIASAFFAFVHHVAAFALVAAVTVQWLLMRDAPTPLSVRRLGRADAIIGAAAITLVVVGTLRVLYFEKGAAFYLHSAGFLAKMALFIGVAVLSIVPTRQFIAWKRALAAGQAIDGSGSAVTTVRRLLHVELVGVVAILLCAALMARGVGHG